MFLSSAIRHFGTPMMKCFDTSTLSIQDPEMELFSGLRNSLLVCLFRVLGFRGFTFHDSRTPDDEES
jgi:hypothetical protein